MPVKQEVSLVCDYCGVAQETVELKKLNRKNGTDWFVMTPAETTGDAISKPSSVFCFKCKNHIDELARISRWKREQRLNPPPPDDLLPEEDLQDSCFTGSIPNPDIACIGSNLGQDCLPPEMRVTKPSWTKRPAVKRKKK